MKKTTFITSLLAVGFIASVSDAGEIKGKVSLSGTPPPEKILPLDPNCSKLHPSGTKPTTRFYETGEANGLKDVVIYLTGISGKSAGDSADPLIIDQIGCEYIPYVAAGQTGQTITVKNSDPLLHNVHPTPKPGTDNKEYNKAQLPNGPDLHFTFPDEEMFLRFKCDVHPWMFSYVSLFDHPYFAVTDKNGSFTISDVPAGTYTVEAYHRKAGKVSGEVEVADGAATINFELEAK